MKSEDLRLNIIVNGDAGRKEILDTEKAISKLESELKSLKKADGDQGLFDIVAAMDEMHLNGQRVTTVLGALANNVEMLKEQQSLANETFMEGTSLTNEFNIQIWGVF